MNRQTMTSVALNWANRKQLIFPCNPNTKRPCVKGGFKSATNDQDQIKKWWKEFPNAMVGIPTGDASGIFVLDIDEHGKVSGNKLIKRMNNLAKSKFLRGNSFRLETTILLAVLLFIALFAASTSFICFV